MSSEKTNPAVQSAVAADAWFYEEKQPFSRRLLCAVAALIGMLVGLLPALVYGLLVHTSYPLLFLCIPLGCLIFEQIFGCRNMKSSVFWILAFTVLGWYLAEVLATAVSFASVYKIPSFELPRLMYYLLVNGLLWKTITGESVYSFLFLILGAWIAFEYTRGGHAPAEAAAVRSEKAEPEATPIEPAEGAPEGTAGSEAPSEAAEAEPAKEEPAAPARTEDTEADDDEDGFEFETLEQFMQNKK